MTDSDSKTNKELFDQIQTALRQTSLPGQDEFAERETRSYSDDESKRADLDLRKMYGYGVPIFIIVLYVAIFCLIILSAVGLLSIAEKVQIALLASAGANSILLFASVAKALFRRS